MASAVVQPQVSSLPADSSSSTLPDETNDQQPGSYEPSADITTVPPDSPSPSLSGTTAELSNSRPSSSPFPSPSSTFIPPPIPGAHEFANKPPNNSRYLRKKSIAGAAREEEARVRTGSIGGTDKDKSSKAPNPTTLDVHGIGMVKGYNTGRRGSADLSAGATPTSSRSAVTPTQATPTQNNPNPGIPSPQSQLQSSNEPTVDAKPKEPSVHEPAQSGLSNDETPASTHPPAADPAKPEPASKSSEPTPDPVASQPGPSVPGGQPPENLPPEATTQEPAQPPPATAQEIAVEIPSTPSTSASSQNPPVPSSPSPSTLSRHSSIYSSRPAPPSPTPSRRSSAIHPLLHRKSSHLRFSYASSSASPRSSRMLMPTAPVAPAPIKIRDFAFPPWDERHRGDGPDAAVPKQWNPNRSSGMSEASSQGGQQPESGGGWAGLKFGFGGGSGFSWGFGKKETPTTPSGNAAAAGQNTAAPFNYGFGTSPQTPSGDSDGFYYAEDQNYTDEDLPLYPGLYRALYAFEPEGTAEMALAEDQIVRVLGRGGGVGWAIVIREADGSQALVPESYLELIQADDEDEEYGAQAEGGPSEMEREDGFGGETPGPNMAQRERTETVLAEGGDDDGADTATQSIPTGTSATAESK